MTIEKIKELLSDGERLTIEFKECTNAISNSVYETVCSFSNRYGGYILMGVDDEGNILVHREYSSAFPAKLVIEKDRLYTENWNKALRHGRIELEEFTPYPKNPLLAKFFVNIGRADKLGSGVRNLYKYTKIYSGGEPELLEDDVFKTIIPLTKNTNADVKADKKPIKADKKPIKADKKKAIFDYITKNGSISNKEAREVLGLAESTTKRFLGDMVKEGYLAVEGEKKNRKYILR
jgi:ATP-dependent DNA helicase RecG